MTKVTKSQTQLAIQSIKFSSLPISQSFYHIKTKIGINLLNEGIKYFSPINHLNKNSIKNCHKRNRRSSKKSFRQLSKNMKMYVKPTTDVATINRATSVSASLAPEVIVQICLAVAVEWDALSGLVTRCGLVRLAGSPRVHF